MSTPHMTGRKETYTKTKTRSASELLDSDGKIDISKVRSLSKRGNKSGHSKLTPQQASDIRKQLINGQSVRQLAQKFDVDKQSILNHANGEIEYCGSGKPEHAPLEYVNNSWRVADD